MRVVFGRDKQENSSLFAGDAWMHFAEAWAREQELSVSRWQVDQKFQAGGTWYGVEWRADVGRFGSWVIEPQP